MLVASLAEVTPEPSPCLLRHSLSGERSSVAGLFVESGYCGFFIFEEEDDGEGFQRRPALRSVLFRVLGWLFAEKKKKINSDNRFLSDPWSRREMKNG